MDRVCWMTPSTKSLDLSLAQVMHKRLSHLRAGTVAGTENQEARRGESSGPLRAACWCNLLAQARMQARRRFRMHAFQVKAVVKRALSGGTAPLTNETGPT